MRDSALHTGEDGQLQRGFVGAFGFQILATEVVDIQFHILFLVFVIFVALIVWLIGAGSIGGEFSAK